MFFANILKKSTEILPENDIKKKSSFSENFKKIQSYWQFQLTNILVQVVYTNVSSWTFTMGKMYMYMFTI